MSTPNLQTPAHAEAAFYSAIETADLDAMMAVWSQDSDTVCIHPQGPRLVGYQEIRESWRQIMRHSPPMRFAFSENNSVRNDDLAIHYVNENIHVSDSENPDFTVLATNVYRRTDDGWRMILHHASATPESLQNSADENVDAKSDQAVTIH